MTNKRENKQIKFAVIGGGLAAGYAAQAFAEAALPRRQVAIFSAESVPPYERPPLSKAFLRGDKDTEAIWINEPGFYEQHGIALHLETPVQRLDLAQRKLETEKGSFNYERLLLATGSKLNTFDLPGEDLQGLHYLRELRDAQQIRSAAQEAETAVVIGGGFIGMEVSAVLRQLGLDVTLMFPEDRVWAAVFPEPISDYFARTFANKGIALRPNSGIAGFEGNERGRLTHVRTKDDVLLPADLVVAGIGVRPDLSLYQDSDLDLNEGILTNRFLATSMPDVYAAGDIAEYRDVLFDKPRRLEHWDNAQAQGRHAAQMMLGERSVYRHVPYFFSDLFDLSYEFWGDSEEADEIVYRGDMDEASFSVWWLSNGRVMAAFILDRPEEERQLAQRWIATQALVDADNLRNPNALNPVMDEEATPG